jgi:hypothetical protein
MRALPVTYRLVERPDGSLARFVVSGDCGGTWHLHRLGGAWQLTVAPAGPALSETVIPQSIAWRLFTKGITRDEARRQVGVSGDEELALHVLGALAIVG